LLIGRFHFPFVQVPPVTASTPGTGALLSARRRGPLVQRAADYFGMSRLEFAVVIVVSLLLIALKTVNLLHKYFDSDEPQHLHVIWSWTQGLVQYRDIFDNHMPLFQIVMAPIAGLIGERATILYWMRFVLFPMYFVAAWCTYQIGARLFSRRVGLWSAIAAGCYPAYYSITSEFRTDNLWAPLWLLCLTVLVRGIMSVRRALVAGLFLGLCFGVSMKSTLFLLSLLISVPLAVVLAGPKKFNLLDLARSAAAFLATTVLIPLIIAAFFALKGDWPSFWYGVFGHQLGPSVYAKKNEALVLFCLILFPVIAYTARRMVTSGPGFQIAIRRAVVLLVAYFYFLILESFWPLLSRDDYPPLDPLIAIFAVGALFAFSDKLFNTGWRIDRILRALPLPAFVVVAELLVVVGTQPFWRDKSRSQTDLVGQVLALTTPRDYILDCKGETIFRRRCFRPVLETITRERIRRGIMPDTAPQDCIRTGTCVVAMIKAANFPPATRRFVERNYLPVADNLRVAGLKLAPLSNRPQRYDFQVVIPADYEIISREQSVYGMLDGTPYRGARFLPSGPHTFEAAASADGLVLLWARAVDRNFTPIERRTSSDR
jgi:Dolichyl-phosphate-mannose-protein mannosyltransferase